MAVSDESLSRDVALVTGGGTGIGRAIALRLAQAGARVAVLGRRREPLERVAGEIADLGGSAMTLVADVTDRNAVHAAVERACDEWGTISLLVNNAGGGKSAPFSKMSREHWDEMIAVNLTGAFHVTRAVVPQMLSAGRGRIISIASVAGLKGYPYIAAYSAAKHGLIGMTRALAVELAGKGITVNAVCPGYVETPMTEQTVANIVEKTGRSPEQTLSELAATSPQRRLFDPEEIASLVVYLCSPTAKGINGQAIPVCGGEMAV